jgi:hypothetical protein
MSSGTCPERSRRMPQQPPRTRAFRRCGLLQSGHPCRCGGIEVIHLPSGNAVTVPERNTPMVFAKRLREGVVRGQITCSIRIWIRPHVKVGARYRMGEGEIEIESITPIGFSDITKELAQESGFLGILDLLKVAKHGKGNNIYLIRFHYVPPRSKRVDQPKQDRTGLRNGS